jgi:hypothetical protein
MRTLISILMAIAFLCLNDLSLCGDPEAGQPIGFLGGCESDLNADGNTDMALLIDTSRGYELVALMKSSAAAKCYHLKVFKSKMHLTCHHGKQLKETDAGPGERKGKTYQTNGTYLKLTQTEGASVAYFWSGDAFREVWTAD